MFNDTLKEQLKKYLQGKSLMPMIPGAGMTHAIAKPIIDAVAPAIAGEVGADANAPAPGVNHGLPSPTPPALPTALPPPVTPSLPSALPQAAPSPIAQSPAPIAQPAAPQIPQLDGKYNDAARQQLYADLAKKHGENAGWAAVGSLGDMAARMGGGTPMNTQQTILAQGAKEDATAREQFESSRKGQIEDIATNLSLKKAGREETEYQDANNPNSQMSKLSVALAMKYAPEQVKAMGWAPGKTSHADVIKVLPIMEKGVALETARANKDLALSEKTNQFNDNKTRQFREEVMGGKPMSGYLTVHGMAKSVRMAAKDPSAYGDLSSIYALVKGLDPTSVVREGEIGLMREVTGLKDRLVSNLEKWGGKGPIDANMMKDIENVMGRLEQIAADNVRLNAEPTLQQARRMGLQEKEIMGDLPTGQSTTQAAPTTPKQLSGGWTVTRRGR